MLREVSTAIHEIEAALVVLDDLIADARAV